MNWENGKKVSAWFDNTKTAQLTFEGKEIGTAGIVDAQFLKKFAEGHAFAFELDGDFIETYKPSKHKFEALSKYPAVERDISMLVPLSKTVAELSHLIADADKHIVSVELIDFFQKNDWKDKKSLTFHYIIRNPHKTFTKKEIDNIVNTVIKIVQNAGATIR